jgi:hypothetical protein
MRKVQQNVLLILNSAPVTYPKLTTRPSIPVMTHSLDQKVMARRQESARLRLLEEISKQGREATQLCELFFCHSISQEQSQKVHQNVCDKSS